MNDLLQHYERELEFLREEGHRFSKQHPSVAQHLRLGTVDEDPVTQKIIEATAFLTARIQQQLDGQYDFISQQWLELFFPYLMNPFPSACLAQFKSSAKLTSTHLLPKHTAIQVMHEGTPFFFRTAYELPIQPLQMTELCITEAMQNGKPMARLQFAIDKIKSNVDFSDQAMIELHVFPALPLKFATRLQAGLLQADPVFDIQLGKDSALHPANTASIVALGFSESECILPSEAHTFSGKQLLIEYYAFPEKFLGFRINIPAHFFAKRNRIYCSKLCPIDLLKLKPHLLANSLRANVVPMINLFSAATDPARVTADNFNIPISARNTAHDQPYVLHQIASLELTEINGNTKLSLAPFLSQTATHAESENILWRFARGEPCRIALEDPRGLLDHTTVYQLNLTALCSQGEQAHPLRYQPEQLDWKLQQTVDEIESIAPITSPTLFAEPPAPEQAYTQLLGHLNHWRIPQSSNAETLTAFKNCLQPYDFLASHRPEAFLDYLIHLQSDTVPFRVRTELVMGQQLTLTFKNDPHLQTAEVWMLGKVLLAFLQSFQSLNTPLRLIVTVEKFGQVGIFESAV